MRMCALIKIYQYSKKKKIFRFTNYIDKGECTNVRGSMPPETEELLVHSNFHRTVADT